jgi:hypothetical protein
MKVWSGKNNGTTDTYPCEMDTIDVWKKVKVNKDKSVGLDE